MISVIVCTYNQEKTIGRALDSILRQHCTPPVEIIIGEDCSTDGTLAICQEYASRWPDRIRLFANPENRGVLRNYFDCLLQARGKYIADLAGDDEWCDPEKLEQQWHFLETHPTSVLVHTNYQLRDEVTGVRYAAPSYPYPSGMTDGKDLTESILTQLERPVVHLCTALYRADAFRRCYEAHTDLFRNADYPCEDLQLCALLSREGEFAYKDWVTLDYSVAVSISRTGDEARQFRFVKGCTQVTRDVELQLSLPHSERLQQFYTYRCFALLMHAFRAHSPQLRHEAIQCIAQWQAKTDLRIRLVRLATANPLLWRAALWLRSQVLRCSILSPSCKHQSH